MEKRIFLDKYIFVDNVTYDDVIKYVDNLLLNKETRTSSDQTMQPILPILIFAQNPLKVVLAAENPRLAEALRAAKFLIPDGIGIILAARLKGKVIKQRVTGVDLISKLISLANTRGYKVYLLGGKPGTAEKAANNLVQKFPNLQVAGISDGYFSDEELSTVIDEINSKSPDILFACMGSPKQELFLFNNMSKLRTYICVGGGGSLDVHAGEAKRAPKLVQKIGFEWLYRLLIDPKRLNRYTSGLLKYVWHVIQLLLR